MLLIFAVPWAQEVSLERQNFLLRKTNQVLLKTLSELSIEQEVGQTSVKSTCPTMTGYKACNGPKHRLTDNYGRREDPQLFSGGWDDGMPGPDFCNLRCENMGIPGCCEYQEDRDECYFTAFVSSTISDSGSRREYGDGFDYELIPLRSASICSVSNCAEYQMETLQGRIGGCDYDNIDSEGRMAKGGGGHSIDSCMDWCLNNPACVFASRSSSGYCHGFKTCSHQPMGTGATTKQKVCKGAYEYNNHPSCTSFMDSKYCIPAWKGVV